VQLERRDAGAAVLGYGGPKFDLPTYLPTYLVRPFGFIGLIIYSSKIIRFIFKSGECFVTVAATKAKTRAAN